MSNDESVDGMSNKHWRRLNGSELIPKVVNGVILSTFYYLRGTGENPGSSFTTKLVASFFSCPLNNLCLVIR
jgi:hypothetical protein